MSHERDGSDSALIEGPRDQFEAAIELGLSAWEIEKARRGGTTRNRTGAVVAEAHRERRAEMAATMRDDPWEVRHG